MEFHPKDIFNNRYVLKELIGRGSFGEVWLSYDTIAEVDVALKIYIALDNRGLSDFKAEFCSVFNIVHPNILKPEHFDVWNKQPYLVMHYCPISGESLIGKLSEKDIWAFIDDVSKGLSYLHELDILHRDIKPDNILKKSQGQYVLSDFGLSKRLHASFRRNSTRTHQEDISGSIPYMGPELFESSPVAVKATDIWALGVTIYEMIMGELPFMGQGGIMLKSGAEIPELPNTYSYGLRKLVHDCLQRNTWDRPTAVQLPGYKDLGEPSFEWLFNWIKQKLTTRTYKRVSMLFLIIGIVFLLMLSAKRIFRPTIIDTNIDLTADPLELQLPPLSDSIGLWENDVIADIPVEDSEASPAAPTVINREPTDNELFQKAYDDSDWDTIKRMASNGFTKAYYPLAKWYFDQKAYSDARKWANNAISAKSDIGSSKSLLTLIDAEEAYIKAEKHFSAKELDKAKYFAELALSLNSMHKSRLITIINYCELWNPPKIDTLAIWTTRNN